MIEGRQKLRNLFLDAKTNDNSYKEKTKELSMLLDLIGRVKTSEYIMDSTKGRIKLKTDLFKRSKLTPITQDLNQYFPRPCKPLKIDTKETIKLHKKRVDYTGSTISLIHKRARGFGVKKARRQDSTLLNLKQLVSKKEDFSFPYSIKHTKPDSQTSLDNFRKLNNKRKEPFVEEQHSGNSDYSNYSDSKYIRSTTVVRSRGTSRSIREYKIADVGYDEDGNKKVNQFMIIGDLGRGSQAKVKLVQSSEDGKFYVFLYCNLGDENTAKAPD